MPHSPKKSVKQRRKRASSGLTPESFSRNRRAAVLRSCAALLALASLTVSTAADVITCDRDTLIKGAVRFYGKGAVELIVDDGTRESVRISRIRTIEFDQDGRCAVLRSTSGAKITVRVSSYASGIFKCYTPVGEEISVKATNLRSAEFFPVSDFAKKLEVCFVPQKPDYCGEACIEMVTDYFGKRVNQDNVNTACKVKGQRGAYSNELERGISELGLITSGELHSPGKTEEEFMEDRMRLLKAVDGNRPVLLGIWYDPKRKRNEAKWGADHFVLLVGYDLVQGCFHIHDPARHAYWSLSFEELVKHRQNRFGTLYNIEFVGFRDGQQRDATGGELSAVRGEPAAE